MEIVYTNTFTILIEIGDGSDDPLSEEIGDGSDDPLSEYLQIVSEYCEIVSEKLMVKGSGLMVKKEESLRWVWIKALTLLTKRSESRRKKVEKP